MQFQTAGLGGGADTYNDAPWAVFGTGGTTDHLYARTNLAGAMRDSDLGAIYLGAPHRYRIDWQANGVTFYVDGAPVATHTDAIAGPMRIAFSDAAPGGLGLTVDWLRLSPYAPACTFTSRVLDGGANLRWLKLTATGARPANTSVTFETRSGNTPTPDASWTAWAAVAGNGDIASSESQYIQYRAALATTDVTVTPEIEQVDLTYEPASVLSSISLQPGWNLVSFTPLPAGTSPSALFAGIRGTLRPGLCLGRGQRPLAQARPRRRLWRHVIIPEQRARPLDPCDRYRERDTPGSGPRSRRHDDPSGRGMEPGGLSGAPESCSAGGATRSRRGARPLPGLRLPSAGQPGQVEALRQHRRE